MLLIHPQFAAPRLGNKLVPAESERDVLPMGDSKVPEWALGAVPKGVYSEVEVMGSSNNGGVGEIEVLNRGAGVVE